MHDILLNAVFNLTDSLRSSALELDRSGDGKIDCVENKALLKLLQKELPEVTLKVNEIGALASAFEGSAGCLVVDDFMYLSHHQDKNKITINMKKHNSKQKKAVCNNIDVWSPHLQIQNHPFFCNRSNAN